MVLINAESDANSSSGDLGAVPSGNTPNMLVFNGGELRLTKTIVLSPRRGWYLGPQGGIFTYGGGSTAQLSSYLVQGPGSINFADISYCAMSLNFAANGGAMTYSGATTFTLSQAGGTGSQPGALSNNPSVIFFSNDNELPTNTAVTINLAYSGTNGTGYLNMYGHQATWGSLAGNGDIVNSSAGTIGLSTLAVGGNNFSTTYSGNLGHSNVSMVTTNQGTSTPNIALVKNGNGTMTMSGTSQYNGGTTINAGTLLVTGQLSGTGNVIVNAGSVLGGNGSVNGALTVAPSGHIAPAVNSTSWSTFTTNNNATLAAGSIFDFNLGTPSVGSSGSVAGSGSGDQFLVSGTGNTLTLNAGVNNDVLNITSLAGFGVGISSSASTAGSYTLLQVAGSATLVDNLTAANWSVNGTTRFNYYVLNPSDTATSTHPAGQAGKVILYVAPGSPTVTWTGQNNTWDTTTNATTNWAPSSPGYANTYNVVFPDGASNTTVVIQPGGVAPRSVTFTNTGSYSFSGGPIADSALGSTALTMTAAGVVTLNNSNTYTGTTLVTAGTLNIGSAGSIASPIISVAGSGVLNVAGSLASNAALYDGSLVAFSSANPTFASLSGPGGVVYNTGGITITAPVGAALSYSGSTTINGPGGALAISSTGGLSSNPASGIIINNSALEATQSFTIGSAITLGAASSTIAVDAGQSLTVNAAISATGGGASTKSGSGALVLSGSNSYGGATTVSAGTLEVDGSLAAASAVAVNNTATLSGRGVIGGTVTVGGSGHGRPWRWRVDRRQPGSHHRRLQSFHPLFHAGLRR